MSIAVSGDKKGKLKISSFYQKMGDPEVKEIETKEGAPALLDIFSYIEFFKGPTQAHEAAITHRFALKPHSLGSPARLDKGQGFLWALA